MQWSKLKFSFREYFNFLFADVVIIYYSLQFLSKAKKKKICVFTVTRPTLIFASDPMHFYTEFG